MTSAAPLIIGARDLGRELLRFTPFPCRLNPHVDAGK